MRDSPLKVYRMRIFPPMISFVSITSVRFLNREINVTRSKLPSLNSSNLTNLVRKTKLNPALHVGS
jgi:hypothetical protein